MATWTRRRSRPSWSATHRQMLCRGSGGVGVESVVSGVMARVEVVRVIEGGVPFAAADRNCS